jgi:multisubunit Na+/H+ antiporter MnhB subunit
MIGGLFLIYGVILTILGLGASEAEKQKAAGWNLNLWVGIAMLVVAALFLFWAFARPLAQELGEPAEDDRTVPGAHAPTGPDAAALGGSKTTRRTPRRDLGRPDE